MNPRRAAIGKLVGSLKADEAKRAREPAQEQGPDGLGDAAKMNEMDPSFAQENTKGIGHEANNPGAFAGEETPMEEAAEGEPGQGLSPGDVQIGMEHVDALKALLEKK